MPENRRSPMLHWTVVAPLVAVVVLALSWGEEIGTPVALAIAVVLAAATLAAVHHAEVVAHRVGEPLGSLLLAVAVTVIEVALIVTLMASGGPDAASLARDTVFAAVMITTLPETLSATRAAARRRVQISLNLAYGSAMASIGLTIPAIAVASLWLEGPLLLGLGSTQLVLLALTIVVSTLTVVPGRATRLQGGVHLVLLAAFLFLAVNP
jgi:Ca2+:H+ antiporter